VELNFAIIATTFPLVAVGELPDKTMFASLLLASRGRPAAVWAGAALAFAAHVVIAVTIGVALFALLPHRVVDVIVAVLFLGGSVYSWRARNEVEAEDAATIGPLMSARRTGATAAGIIFLAEWGDLTQILTADLAARYHDALSVGIGALTALWVVAAVAVIGGSTLVRLLSVRVLRTVTAVALLALGVSSVVAAVRA
jgi:putative Ca2+/H+ antiporter (TMEM165/GDT1 family)